jgi:hypothetical protein
MAYMRGANYVWSDGDRVHFWCADGDDGWDESGWAEAHRVTAVGAAVREPRCASGVGVPHDVADTFVMLRFAELVVEGLAAARLESALELSGGNFGSHALIEYADRLRAVIAQLTPLSPRRWFDANDAHDAIIDAS